MVLFIRDLILLWNGIFYGTYNLKNPILKFLPVLSVGTV